MNVDQEKSKDTGFDGDTSIPKHLAVIMDGNSRWAQRENLSRSDGHRAGAEAARRLLKHCNTLGVKMLTLFVFSSENWGRPKEEVRGLLALLARYLRNELSNFNEEEVSIRFVGRRSRLSRGMRRLISHVETVTAENNGAILVLAVDYGGRWDITETEELPMAQWL